MKRIVGILVRSGERATKIRCSYFQHDVTGHGRGRDEDRTLSEGTTRIGWKPHDARLYTRSTSTWLSRRQSSRLNPKILNFKKSSLPCAEARLVPRSIYAKYDAETSVPFGPFGPEKSQLARGDL